MVNVICKLFGHRDMKPGWYGDAKYGLVNIGNTDGIGTIHATITNNCDRCGEHYIMARFHVNTTKIISALIENGDVNERA